MIYDFSHKTLICPKPLHIRFGKLDGSVRVYDGTTTLVIIFWDFLIFEQILLSTQVKRSVIICNKYGIYELPHELLSDIRFRTLRNDERSKKSQKFIEL